MDLDFVEEPGQFLEEQTKRIISRYYYYHHLQKRPKGLVFDMLCEEFLLKFNDMEDFINANEFILKNLLTSNTTVKELKNEYHWLVWK